MFYTFNSITQRSETDEIVERMERLSVQDNLAVAEAPGSIDVEMTDYCEAVDQIKQEAITQLSVKVIQAIANYTSMNTNFMGNEPKVCPTMRDSNNDVIMTDAHDCACALYNTGECSGNGSAQVAPLTQMVITREGSSMPSQDTRPATSNPWVLELIKQGLLRTLDAELKLKQLTVEADKIHLTFH